MDAEAGPAGAEQLPVRARCSISLSPLFISVRVVSLAMVGPDVIRRPKSERSRCPDCTAGFRFWGEDLMWSSNAGSGVPQLPRGSYMFIHSFLFDFFFWGSIRKGFAGSIFFFLYLSPRDSGLPFFFLLGMNELNMKRVNLHHLLHTQFIFCKI
jgi:hypothetical protein